MQKHQLKTLAKTLGYIGAHSPDEFGLYWDPDGSMPWKEFYWALQEDDSLRFVRESHLKEFALLGIDLPFTLDGNRLRLCSAMVAPIYPLADNIPERLYYAVKPKTLVYIQQIGIKSANRPYMPVCAEKEMAVRIAKRREPDPLLIEILGHKARDSGISFRKAGDKLFLVDAVASEFLILPKIRELEAAPEKKQKPTEKLGPVTPGSFLVQPQHVHPVAGKKATRKTGRKDKEGWKTESRKDRRKRDI